MKSITKFVRISPKKVNLVADLVRLKSVNESLRILKFVPKKAAPLLYKAIKSAAANAENNFKQQSANLFIQEIYVNEGPTLKRRQEVSRGRSHPILKRSTHIKIFLSATADSEKKKPKPQTEVAQEEKKPAIEIPKPKKRPSKKAKPLKS